MIQLIEFLSWTESRALVLHGRRTVILGIWLVVLLIMVKVRILMMRHLAVSAVVIVRVLLLCKPLLLLVVLIVVMRVVGLLVSLMGLIGLVPIVRVSLWLHVLLLEDLLLLRQRLYLGCLVGL